MVGAPFLLRHTLLKAQLNQAGISTLNSRQVRATSAAVRCIGIVYAALLGSNIATANAGDIDRSFRIPLLSFSASGDSGECNLADFRLTRKPGVSKPLTISVAEDTPGGVGPSVRASIWLAATVAALDRMDDLSGVSISVELSGQTDGPSAGAAFCLAILSALRETNFPDDCAVTGTVMPDGTIGGVGEIATKMKAAAGKGIKRILLPANVRFETSTSNGAEIDLKRLAESLGVEFCPVESVTHAYGVMHRIPPPTRPPVGRDVLDLPREIEEALKARYQEHEDTGRKLWESIPKAERDLIEADPLLAELFVTIRETSIRAYRSGKLLSAAALAYEQHIWLKALAEYRGAPFESPKDVAECLRVLQQTSARVAQELPQVGTLSASASESLPEGAAQLCASISDIWVPLGLCERLKAEVESLSQGDLAAGDQDKNQQLATGLGDINAYARLYAFYAVENSKSWLDERRHLSKAFVSHKVAGDARIAERLFFSAHTAVLNTLLEDVVTARAAELRLTNEQVLGQMTAHDLTLTYYLKAVVVGRSLHDFVSRQDDGSTHAFDVALAAHVHADNLATVSGLIARWSELELDFSGGTGAYRRTEVLNYLLTAAREAAIANIAVCRSRGIECLQPIYYFEIAELSRDDGASDKVDVLIAYWKASLQAKALLLCAAERQSRTE